MGRPMDEFKAYLDNATSGHDPKRSIPNAAAIAVDTKGNVLHTLTSGLSHQHPLSPSTTQDPQPFTQDTVCWIASCSKLLTTLCCLQLVDRGLLSLTAPISTLLPELSSPRILVAMSPAAGPTTRPAKTPITLTHLLTHTSGLGYEFSHPKLAAWRAWSRATKAGRARHRSSRAEIAYDVPLLFEPGEGWVYGYGIDWAGVAVVRASGAASLEDYMARHVFAPLGMHSTSFLTPPSSRADLLPRLARMTQRSGDGDGDGDSGRLEDGSAHPMGNAGRVHFSGGGGLFSTAADFARLLAALMHEDPPVRLVSPELHAAMFDPGHVSAQARRALERAHANPEARGALAGNVPPAGEGAVAAAPGGRGGDDAAAAADGSRLSYGLGGLLTLRPIRETGRSAGALQWGGLPNLVWCMSPRDGVAMCFFGQLVPPGDVTVWEIWGRWERAVLAERRERRERGKL